MKKHFLLIVIILAILSIFSCSSNKTNDNILAERTPVKKLYDYVFELPEYTSLRYDIGLDFIGKKLDTWPKAGCTAVVKVTDDKQVLVGRNMDYFISNDMAFIVRTNAGKYRTIGLTCLSDTPEENYESVSKSGSINSVIAAVIPFASTDVLNDKGLHIEMNMREGEYWPDASNKFACTGTNPGKERVCVMMLPRLIAENCANIEEAKAYVDSLDLYTINMPGKMWNLCFMLTDESGNNSLLEVACNKAVWTDKTPIQANFYVAKELNDIQEYKIGVGRYQYAMKRLNTIKSKKDMFNLMDDISYAQSYHPFTCKFDARSEQAHVFPWWTTSYLLDDKNKTEVNNYIENLGKKRDALTREQVQDLNFYWESTFTEVVDCKNKSIFVRFFEDNDKTCLISIGEPTVKGAKL